MSTSDNIYLIGEATYEDTVDQRVLLCGYVRQLAFLAKKATTIEDFRHLKEVAHIYGELAENLFSCWDIPNRYLVFGDTADLEGIKNIELLDCGKDGSYDTDEAVGAAFFDNMEELISKSKAVTADMEALLAELDSAMGTFCHEGSN